MDEVESQGALVAQAYGLLRRLEKAMGAARVDGVTFPRLILYADDSGRLERVSCAWGGETKVEYTKLGAFTNLADAIDLLDAELWARAKEDNDDETKSKD